MRLRPQKAITKIACLKVLIDATREKHMAQGTAKTIVQPFKNSFSRRILWDLEDLGGENPQYSGWGRGCFLKDNRHRRSVQVAASPSSRSWKFRADDLSFAGEGPCCSPWGKLRYFQSSISSMMHFSRSRMLSTA